MRESDLLAFQIAIEKSKPASVMCAYNLVKVGSDWACQQRLPAEHGAEARLELSRAS
jgi:beta-glucosidase-like glycosyl hydrolase